MSASARPDTFGGEVNTPTLSRLADQGISYNTFHTTSICSPTRAALLTGRNHQRVGNGTIAERAVDWDGYTGIIPKTSATMAEVLHDYGYKTAAFGKWHNTPADQTTSMGPFDRWPTGHGFDYFYGFLAGETSQWEPRLVENTNQIEPPHDEKYHLTEDLAHAASTGCGAIRPSPPTSRSSCIGRPAQATGRIRSSRNGPTSTKASSTTAGTPIASASSPAKNNWAGFRPTPSSPRGPKPCPAGTASPKRERPFQRRLMEVFAGFVEHTDAQAGRLIDELDHLGIRDNTIVFYIFGDNGASAEGQNGTISELLAQNGIPNTVEQQIAALDKLGGLDVLGGPKTDNMYHAGWAWAGNTPFQYTKLIASHFGGTRNPMVDLVAQGHQARQYARGRNSITSTISRRRSTRLSVSSRHRLSTALCRTRSTASAWPTPSTIRGADAQEGAILRQQRQPRDLSGRLVCRHLRSADSLVHQRPGPGSLGCHQGSVGSYNIRRILRGQRSRRRKPKN